MSELSGTTGWASCKEMIFEEMSDWPLQTLWEANMAWHHDKGLSWYGMEQISWWLPDASVPLSDHGAEVADLFNK